MMNLLNLNKKAQAAKNILIAPILLFGGGMIFIIMAIVIKAMLDTYRTSSIFTDAMIPVANSFEFGILVWDYIIIILMAFLIIGIGVTSYKLSSKPVFFIFTLFSAAFYGFISYFLSYVFQEIMKKSVFLSISAIFPRTILICTNLHWVSLVMIVVGAITLYGKREEGQYLT